MFKLRWSLSDLLEAQKKQVSYLNPAHGTEN